MTHQPDNSTDTGKPAGPKRSPFQILAPIALGLVVGSALYAGYFIWSHYNHHQAPAEAPGDADMAKPAPDECAIARAALHTIRVTGADKAWQTGAGVSEMSLATYSKVINPADVSGYSDDEADNLRSKSAAEGRRRGARLRGVPGP
jgi:hypothetical protein